MLLAQSEDSASVSLDAIGDALGTLAVSTDEIDGLITALEGAGRTVDSRRGGDGEESLRIVLAAARVLRAELGRSPTTQEVAARTQLPMERVEHALHLANVIAR